MPGKLSSAESLAFTTVRIECETVSGKTSVGTGFFFNFTISDTQVVPVIITNRHVVESAVRGTFYVTVSDDDGIPIIGRFYKIELDDFGQRWVGHPEADVDLCVMPIAPLFNIADKANITLCLRFFDKSTMTHTLRIGDLQLENHLDAIEEIVMVGYPIGLWDPVNNMPIIRRGITATHPNVDYLGRKEFLIDAACFPGSSGSPVLIFNSGTYAMKPYTTPNGGTISATASGRLILLGVLYAGPQHTVEGKLEVVQIPTQMTPVPVSRIPMNLGIVIKAEKILDFEPILIQMHEEVKNG